MTSPLPTKFLTIFLFFVFFKTSFRLHAQDTNAWEKTTTKLDELHYVAKNPDEQLKSFTLIPKKLIALLADAPKGKEGLENSTTYIDFPNAQGYFVTFKVAKTMSMAPALQNKFPLIKNYIGQAINDPSIQLYFSISPVTGIYVMMTDKGQEFSYIIKTKKKNTYTYYRGNDIQREQVKKSVCVVDTNLFSKKTQNKPVQKHRSELANYPEISNAMDGKRNTYQLALGVTSDMSNRILNGLGISGTAEPNKKKEAILSWLNQVLIKVNAIYSRDLSIDFQLIPDNDLLLFLDADTDPLSSSKITEIINEFPKVCQETLGHSNYNLGHLITYGEGGIAALESLCSEEKEMAVTGMQYAPDPYIGTLAHEIGHQFGARHSFNNCENYNEHRSPASGVEPGSGNTIMGYAGLCKSTDVESGEQLFFHTNSISEIKTYLKSVKNCGSGIDTENFSPTANAGKDYVIPKATPFVLTGSAIDQDETEMTYTWSQMNTEFTAAPPLTNTPVGPIFQWISPSTNTLRYFPNLNTIKKGDTANTWEVLPNVARSLDFRFTVRDNDTRGGQTAIDETLITVDGTAGPFQVTSQNTNAPLWFGATKQEITWDVANTDQGAVNSPLVDLLFSTDEGRNFTHELATAIPNSGNYELIVPTEIVTSKGRLMIRGNDNIFFDINNTNISIMQSNFILDVAVEERAKTVCLQETTDVTYLLSYKTLNDFDQEVRFSLTGEGLEGVNAIFTPDTASNNSTVTLKIEGFTPEMLGQKMLTVSALSTDGLETSTQLNLLITKAPTNIPKKLSPYNKKTDVKIPLRLDWRENNLAAAYTIQLATDPNFNVIAIEEQASTNRLFIQHLEYDTKYYWRVKAMNYCGETDYSETYYFTTQSDNRTYIPDDSFEGLLIGLGYDDVMDDHIITNNIERLKVLDISNAKISDLTGIEDFRSLNNLKAGGNEIEIADLSQNKGLVSVHLENNNINEIKLPTDSKIELLWLAENKLKTLNLATQYALQKLNVTKNELNKLTVKSNVNLDELAISNNQFSSIDISKNTALELFYAYENKINEINLANNLKLRYLWLSNNPIDYLELSKLTKLESFKAIDTKLNYLNLKNGNNDILRSVHLQSNPYLVCVEVDNAEKASAKEGEYFNWSKEAQTTFSENCNNFDSDSDGIKNPFDLCPFSPIGATVDFNGCAEEQLDSDQDGINNALDNCPNTLSNLTVNGNGCALSNLDSDGDGVNDSKDQFNNTPEGSTVDLLGGVVLPFESFNLIANTPNCPGTATGFVTFNNASGYYFDIKITGNNYVQTYPRILGDKGFEISNLLPGNYDFTFSFSDDYGADIKDYIVIIGEATPVSASKVALNYETKTAHYQVAGAKKYNIYLNSFFQKTVLFSDTSQNSIDIQLKPGENQIEIKSGQNCQKSYEETILLTNPFVVYPNPANEEIHIEGAEGILRIYTILGELLYEEKARQKMIIDISKFQTGIYFLSAQNFNQKIEFKQLLKK